MSFLSLTNDVADYVAKFGTSGAPVSAAVPRLTLLHHNRQTSIEATLYNPAICLILQGEKETVMGKHHVRFGAGQSLIVSHDVPVVSAITKAPYLAMILSLDLALLRSLYQQVADDLVQQTSEKAITPGETDPDLINALQRYLGLSKTLREARVLGPLILREIHYRLLIAPHGGMLRDLLLRDSHGSSIARAIERIRQNFRKTLKIPELAKLAGMSESSFHSHFRKITGTTPLQYQKELRLLEARRMLGRGRDPVTNIAFSVGYESPTQFSREYSRKFGVPPRQDVGRVAATL